MKVTVISTMDGASERYHAAQQQGYITFIYTHADPFRLITTDKFMYVQDDAELSEKLHLLRMDPTAVDQVLRF